MLAKKVLMIGVLTLAAAGFSSAAQADGNVVAGALVGGTVGAVIGHSLGGRDGGLVGGVLGAATGASIANSNRYYDGQSSYGPSYGSGGRATVVVGAPGYYAPPPVAYYGAPPVVYEPRVVYQRPPVPVYRPGYVVRYDRYDRRYDRYDGYHDHDWRGQDRRDHDRGWRDDR